MSKFEIKLTDDELQLVWFAIGTFKFPDVIKKQAVSHYAFGNKSDWNIRKVREAVSRLQTNGYSIIAHNGGYSVFGDDPQPVIEYLNREYHRVYEARKKNDQVYAAFKYKYGDTSKIEMIPGQPGLNLRVYDFQDPPFRKSIDARGNEIALQFEEDA